MAWGRTKYTRQPTYKNLVLRQGLAVLLHVFKALHVAAYKVEKASRRVPSSTSLLPPSSSKLSSALSVKPQWICKFLRSLHNAITIGAAALFLFLIRCSVSEDKLAMGFYIGSPPRNFYCLSLSLILKWWIVTFLEGTLLTDYCVKRSRWSKL